MDLTPIDDSTVLKFFSLIDFALFNLLVSDTGGYLCDKNVGAAVLLTKFCNFNGLTEF